MKEGETVAISLRKIYLVTVSIFRVRFAGFQNWENYNVVDGRDSVNIGTYFSKRNLHNKADVVFADISTYKYLHPIISPFLPNNC